MFNYSAANPVAYESGFHNLVVFDFGIPWQGESVPISQNLSSAHFLPVKSTSLSMNQKSITGMRFAGEGIDPNTFTIFQIDPSFNVSFPLRAPALGYIDPLFVYIWEYTRLAYLGSAITCVATLRQSISQGNSEIYITNIADFSDLVLPFNIIIEDSDNTKRETLTAVSVDKSLKKIICSANCQFAHNAGNRVFARPIPVDITAREPEFSIYSSLDGRLYPCMVNKLSCDISFNKSIDISLEIKCPIIDRTYQKTILAQRDQIMSDYSFSNPYRMAEGFKTKISTAAGENSLYGLPGPLDDPLLNGFESFGINDFNITGISINIDNGLAPCYTSRSVQFTKAKKHKENINPIGYYSEGRTINGMIKYKSSLDSRVVMERIAGSSGFNSGGLCIDTGYFKVNFSDIAWSPSKTDNQVENSTEKTFDFNVLSNARTIMPILEYSN